MNMSVQDFVAVAGLFVTVLGVLIVPALIVLIRILVRWAHVESKLDTVALELKEIVEDQKEERTATDRRLRWLEEYLWSGKGANTNAIRNQERRR